MFKALFNIIINLVASIIQIVVWPLNTAITAVVPDFSSKLVEINTTIGSIFTHMSWAISILPPVLITTLLFIIACEIAKHTIFVSTHALLKIWNIIQKIKFW